MEALALVDTGASSSIIGTKFYEKIGYPPLTPQTCKLKGITGTEIKAKGRAVLRFEIGGKEFLHTFTVCNVSDSMVLGRDFQKKHQAVIEYSPLLEEDGGYQ